MERRTFLRTAVVGAEVLPVLRAAGIAGQPVRQALDFLTSAIPEHCRPRQKGGRGEHTRFVAFGLAALLSHPRSSTTTAWPRPCPGVSAGSRTTRSTTGGRRCSVSTTPRCTRPRSPFTPLPSSGTPSTNSAPAFDSRPEWTLPRC